MNVSTVPRHIAIIMDGNGRWARQRGLERCEGHVEGARAVRDTCETAARLGVEHLTLYAFSVANWSRPRPEVEALMGLLVDFARRERADLRQNGIRVQVIGHVEELPPLTRQSVEELVEYTSGGDRLTLNLALSYGARQDVVEAARALAMRVAAGLISAEEIDEAALRRHMSTSELPDVDLLIRTGGEQRLSDFLLLEAAYAELLFVPEMWPEFGAEMLREAIAHYARRQRRFGLTGDQVDQGADGRVNARAHGGLSELRS